MRTSEDRCALTLSRSSWKIEESYIEPLFLLADSRLLFKSKGEKSILDGIKFLLKARFAE